MLPAAVADAIDEMVREEMRRQGGVGVALAVTDRDGVIHRGVFGLANRDAGTPVSPSTLFQFGSIGKAFTAVVVLQLVHEGRLDLSAPVTDLLPWFQVKNPWRPIRLVDLLTHSSGLIEGTDAAPDARSEVWALRETALGHPPGTNFHYSNVGYKVVGLALERLTGRPYPDLVRERVLDPLEMWDTEPSITHAMRLKLAVGHVPLFDDRPYLPGDALVPAPWIETDTADGCLAAHAVDLAAFARMLLNEGDGPHGRVLCPEHFKELIAPRMPVSPDMAYGLGLMRAWPQGEDGGRRLVHHGGGMLGYESGLALDLDAGVGVVTLSNGLMAVDRLARAAVAIAAAGEDGPPHFWLPAAREEDGADPGLVGAYRSMGPHRVEDVEVRAVEGRLTLWQAGSLLGALTRIEDDAFLLDHPDWRLYPLTFRREGRVAAELWHGDRWFSTLAYAGPLLFETPPLWEALVGHYRAHNPWSSNFRVGVRKGHLWMFWPRGYEWRLAPAEAGPADVAFRCHDGGVIPETVVFETPVDGRMLHARLADQTYHRFFTP